MDKKRLILVGFVSVLIVGAWIATTMWLQKNHPEWFVEAPPAQPQPQPSTPPTTTISSTQPGPTTAVATTQPGRPVAQGTARPIEATLGYAKFDPEGKQPWPLGLTLTSRGAAIKSVTLNRFRRAVDEPEPYVFQRPYESIPKYQYSYALATRALVVDDQPVDLFDVNWEMEKVTDSSVTFSVPIRVPGGSGPLVVRKHYEIRRSDAPSQGYQVAVNHSFENLTGKALKVQLAFNGPNVPAIENSRDVPEVLMGHPGDGEVKLEHAAMSSYTPEGGPANIERKNGFLWVGMTSAYFSAIVQPQKQQASEKVLASVTAQAVAPHEPSTGQQFIALDFKAEPVTLAAGQSDAIGVEVFLGPRKRELVRSDYYAAYPREYNRILVLTGWFCGLCTWPWLIDALVGLLRAFHFVLFDWGLAIIALVVLVRLILHPITKKSQVSMAGMQKMGPEIERLKKKYGDNKEELNRAMMAFYKEQGFTPILGCLPMFLQMPIWIALWTALQTTFELRHSPFLYFFGVQLTWIDDLAQPDRLIAFSPIQIPLMGAINGLNLLPILMAFVFWMQQKYMPKPPATSPEQEQQQKMMQYMTLLFPLLLYTGPAGLNLYILTSTAIGIWESRRIRRHIEEKEQREKAGRVIIDAPSSRNARRAAQNREEQRVEAEPGGCLGAWFVNLQKKAEDLRRQADKRNRK